MPYTCLAISWASVLGAFTCVCVCVTHTTCTALLEASLEVRLEQRQPPIYIMDGAPLEAILRDPCRNCGTPLEKKGCAAIGIKNDVDAGMANACKLWLVPCGLFATEVLIAIKDAGA